MDPPPLRNGSSATVEVIPYLDDVDGSPVGVVLIKERFTSDLRRQVHRIGDAEIRVVDDPFDPDAAETSSIRYPSDLCLRKPSTDVVVVGSAMAPGRREVRELDVSLKAPGIDKRLRAIGPRAWFMGEGSLRLTSPEPFSEMPVRWERAFGGSDYESEPDNPIEEPRNPNGVGVVRAPETLVGTLGPCIEDPEDLIETSRTRPKPAGLGVIGRHWAPRRSYTGTFDDAWMEERMPLLPLDFDPRFNQVVAPDQVTPQPLRGGESFEVIGMNERGPIRFELPRLHFFVGVQTADTLTETKPQIDTVLLEPNERAFEITWRSKVRLPRRAADLRFVQVHEKRRVP